MAKQFVSVSSVAELKEVLTFRKDVLVIGGGSNMLLVKEVDKLVVHLNTKGIEVLKQDSSSVWLEVAAGENWHDFVLWCLDNHYGGIENLALIPGNVGTAPIQNIGAYGVEVKEVIEAVHVINIETLETSSFKNEECHFAYRDSIFKQKVKGKYLITSVRFKLTKSIHKINLSYGSIKDELAEQQVSDPSIKNIAEVVIAIRTSKLPDPKKIGNSGSFFKNPVVSIKHFTNLQKEYPSIPSYPVNASSVKLAAGWLIDQCGLKGKRIGDAGVHKNQALVLVNYGNASGKEILNLAQKVQDTVTKRFGVQLEMEVNIIQ